MGIILNDDSDRLNDTAIISSSSNKKSVRYS